jgi:hypothetical protein
MPTTVAGRTDNPRVAFPAPAPARGGKTHLVLPMGSVGASPGELDLQLAVVVSDLDLDLQVDVVGHAHGDATTGAIELDSVVPGESVGKGMPRSCVSIPPPTYTSIATRRRRASRAGSARGGLTWPR